MDEDDCITFAYNRQQQIVSVTDQNGAVHAFDFDQFGRQIHDCVTTVGDGVDGAVRRISTEYDVRGMKARITSYDNPTVGSGNILNDCRFVYNDFGQLVTEYQSHGGAVNTSTTPKVQYGYADGAANTIRPESLTYPNGRVVSYGYGTAGSVADRASRVAAIIDDDDTHLADYSYLGQQTFVIQDNTEPQIEWTLVDLTSSNDPETGDIYSGLDRFGRVKDNRWYNYNAAEDVDRIQYGYDRAGNRIWRKNVVAESLGKHFDELYGNDAIHRLKEMDRGTLTALKDAITNNTFAQCWSLDPTGNWKKFLEDSDGTGSWDLNQTRTANRVNEITGITEATGPSWVTPAYNRAGNMTTMPKVADPTVSQTCQYDAWNRLTKVSEGEDTVAEYQYDGAKRRIVQKSYSSGTLSETRHLYYTEPSKWQVIEERVGTSPDSTDAERQFVWGLRYIDDLVLRDRDTDESGTLEERLYACQDANWNVTTIIDASDNVQERYAFTAYGLARFLTPAFLPSSSRCGWETLFGSYRFDQITAFYYVRNRAYHGALGTWVQWDPIRYRGGISLCQYAGNNPTNVIDPSGTRTCKEIDKLLKDGYKPDAGTGCVSINLEDYLDWRETQNDLPVPDELLNQLRRGCIGLCAGLQACDPRKGPYNDWPERAPDTTCYMTEADARRQRCPAGTTPFYFAKMGRPFSPENPWIIPNADGTFNYITYNAGCYMDMNCGAGQEEEQTIRFCDKHPGPGERYPAWMWCVTCKPCRR